MTISSQVRTAGPFIGDGLTDTFPFAFKVFAAADLLVVKLDETTNTESTLTLTTDYTVTLNANQDANPGGSVTLVGGALPADYTVTVTSEIEFLQPTDLTNQGGFYPKVISNALDRLTILLQQLLTMINRGIKFPLSDGATGGELPPRAVRANKFLTFDDNGDPTVDGAINTYYYGALASDPLTRPNSSAVQVGDYYFSTTLAKMLVYNGSDWSSASAESSFSPAQIGVLEDVADSTSAFALTLLNDANAAAMRTTLSVISAADAQAGMVGRLVDIQVFNTAGTHTWNNPLNLGDASADAIVEIIIVSGGASGGGAADSTAGNIAVGANGGGGAYMHAIIAASRLGATETVTVGAGGAAVANSAGNAGGISRFSASGSQYILCTGGQPGTNLADGSTVGLATGGIGGSSVAWPGAYWTVLKVQNGQQGDISRRLSGTEVITGKGGDSLHGMGGTMAGNGVGFGAIGVGGGGSGSVCINGASGNYGGGGQTGICIVRTYY